ncbi:MAG: hypothetical protein LBG80_08940 [Bacteroidales bacterium]|jgi:hypothetical protein|nr:hypothetical protein [Bacteroidales bacterium]
MAKFIVAKDFHIELDNCKYGSPYIRIKMPIDFSYLDLIQIIKIYTNYKDTYEWDFFFPYYQMNLLSKHKKEELGNIKIRQYFEVPPNMDCIYGPIKINIGKMAKSFNKYHKVYPVAFEAAGIFPSEEEFRNKKLLKDITKKYTEEDLKEFNSILKEYFKNKYKISDEIYPGEESFYGNMLIKK